MFEKIGLGFLIFIVTFWIVIFMILPLMYEPQDHVMPGSAESAPKNVHFKFTFLLTSLISLMITFLILKYAEQGLASLSSTDWAF